MDKGRTCIMSRTRTMVETAKNGDQQRRVWSGRGQGVVGEEERKGRRRQGTRCGKSVSWISYSLLFRSLCFSLSLSLFSLSLSHIHSLRRMQHTAFPLSFSSRKSVPIPPLFCLRFSHSLSSTSPCAATSTKSAAAASSAAAIARPMLQV